MWEKEKPKYADPLWKRNFEEDFDEGKVLKSLKDKPINDLFEKAMMGKNI